VVIIQVEGQDRALPN